MSTITTRANKGVPLTHDEVDANFNNINNDLIVAEAEIDALQGSLITGPASSTDNAFSRFDGTTGKLIQNGQTTEDDSGNVSVAGTLTAASDIAVEAQDSGALVVDVGKNGTPDSGYLAFRDNAVAQWMFWKTSTNTLRLYDNVNAETVLEVTQGGSTVFTPSDRQVDITGTGGNVYLNLISETDNVELFLSSNVDGLGGENCNIQFVDNGSSIWQLRKASDNQFRLYDAANTTNFITATPGGALNFTPTGETQIGGDRILTEDGGVSLIGGFTSNDYAHGTVSSGTITPSPGSGEENFQTLTNGGAFTLAPPANSCTVTLQITNNASAGAITTSGFTKVDGAFTTTNGDDFMCRITVCGGFSHLEILALQ